MIQTQRTSDRTGQTSAEPVSLATIPTVLPFTSRYRLQLYSALLRVRPAQLAEFLKTFLCIRRLQSTTLTGQVFWIDPASIFGIELLRYGVYERQMTALLELVLGPYDTFLDIGGNEGYFSVIASNLVRFGQVHCFEPQARLYPVLRENLRLNGAENVVLHGFAVSDKDGSAEVFLKPSTNSGASSMFSYGVGRASQNVQTVALDSFFARNGLDRVRLMKIDCEGAEGLVVRGAEEILTRKAIDFIAMEYHPQICGFEECERIHRFLKSCGYVLTKLGEQTIYHLAGLDASLQPLGQLTMNCDLGNHV